MQVYHPPLMPYYGVPGVPVYPPYTQVLMRTPQAGVRVRGPPVPLGAGPHRMEGGLRMLEVSHRFASPRGQRLPLYHLPRVSMPYYQYPMPHHPMYAHQPHHHAYPFYHVMPEHGALCHPYNGPAPLGMRVKGPMPQFASPYGPIPYGQLLGTPSPPTSIGSPHGSASPVDVKNNNKESSNFKDGDAFSTTGPAVVAGGHGFQVSKRLFPDRKC